jgi:hypothetical protein
LTVRRTGVSARSLLEFHKDGWRSEAGRAVPRLIELLEEQPESAAQSHFPISCDVPRKTHPRGKVFERGVFNPGIADRNAVDARGWTLDEGKIALEIRYAAMIFRRHSNELIAQAGVYG